MRQCAGIVVRIRPDLREGDVAGRLDESAEGAVGHRRAVDPERVDADAADGCFLGMVLVRPHAERAAGDEDHAGRLTVFTSGGMSSLQAHFQSASTRQGLGQGNFARAPMRASIAAVVYAGGPPHSHHGRRSAPIF
jgi:hypothetical protein